MPNLNALKQAWGGIILAVIVGIVAMAIKDYFTNIKSAAAPMLDSLIIALVIGAILRSFIKFNEKFTSGFKITPLLFIPIGVIFYGAVNLNFPQFASVEPGFIFVVLIVFIVYLTSTFLLSSLFNIKDKTSYLVATGSAICGASAIAVTTNAIDAEPDDVSNSLVSVFISALLGLFVVLPFVAVIFHFNGLDYAVMSGALLQFTGFVKAAVANLPMPAVAGENLSDLALSIKAIRYVGLLFMIPIFSSIVKKKFHVPWYLWAFLIAGIIFSFVPGLHDKYNKEFTSILNYLWSIAMAAIGLNANIKSLFSKTGVRVFAVSFISFLITTSVFVGMYMILRNLII